MPSQSFTPHICLFTINDDSPSTMLSRVSDTTCAAMSKSGHVMRFYQLRSRILAYLRQDTQGGIRPRPPQMCVMIALLLLSSVVSCFGGIYTLMLDCSIPVVCITVGTFQGSSLGPLLFNIMANDLSTYIPATIDGFRVTVTRYADDTQIVLTGPKNRLAEMQSSMSSVLDDMLTWFLQHGTKVNTKKTELLLIGGPRMPYKPEDVTPISVLFNGETIHESQSGYVRNLGVTMDKNLNWVKHIDKTVAKCCGILIGLASAKNVLPLNVLPRLIDALVFSHLRYCVQVYGNASNCHLRKIQKVFNFAARIISGRRKFDRISDVTRALGWLSAREFVEFNDICLLHYERGRRPSEFY